ncbi:MAG: AmmeMemoRadiSam system protein A [Gudongella sp.]|jgi:AmmeMemoRadiSam system protein A|nr:AmmeMemoRadiSam system protein A [Gudongella sp.]
MGRLLSAFLTPHPPIIISEIGRGDERKAKNTVEAMTEVGRKIAEAMPQTILLITPHGPVFSDANAISTELELKGDFGQFGHSKLSYSYANNQDLVYQIIKNSLSENIPVAQMTKEMYKRYGLDGKLDHGALVPLHFIEKEYSDFDIVHITYGILSPKELYLFGRQIEKAIIQQKKDVTVIASGDLSHRLLDSGPYSFNPKGPIFDKSIMEAIENCDLEAITNFDADIAEEAGECGLRSLMILAGILSPYELTSDVLSYEGPFGVGYGVAALYPGERINSDILSSIEESQAQKLSEKRENESEHVHLARMSLEHYIRTGGYIEVPPEISEELLEESRPVFVTLKKNGTLRGCIGATSAQMECTAMEIIHFAVEAGTHDPRFPAVEEDELNELTYSVDVLMPAEPISSVEELDPDKFGVIVKKGFRKGLLLPMLEGVDTAQEQVRIALGKAGIGEDEDYTLERFKVNRFY